MPTQTELAKALNLSASTVSRSLRGEAGINSRTRTRVLEAASKMGYDWSGQHRATATRRAKVGLTLSVMINRDAAGHDLVNERPTAAAWDVLAGASEEARRLGHTLNVHFFAGEEIDALATGAGDPAELHDNDPVGLLVIRRFPDAVLDRFAAQYPTVFLCQSADDRPADSVDLDANLAVRRLYQQLAAHGHERIGYVQECSVVCEQRFAGYMQAAALHGHRPPADAVLNVYEPTEREVFGQQLLRATKRGVTAWICAGTATAVAKALDQAGYRIPEDVSLAAVEQDPPYVRGRQLTHVVGDFHPVGQVGMRMAIERLNDRAMPPRSVLLRPGEIHGQTLAEPNR